MTMCDGNDNKPSLKSDLLKFMAHHSLPTPVMTRCKIMLAPTGTCGCKLDPCCQMNNDAHENIPTAAMEMKNFSIAGPFVDESFVHVNCWLDYYGKYWHRRQRPKLCLCCQLSLYGPFFRFLFIMVSVTGSSRTQQPHLPLTWHFVFMFLAANGNFPSWCSMC